MTKEFNVTGLCFSDVHYMADISKKVDATYKMIEKGDYFIINRPRQYGKTTMLYTLTEKLIKSNNYVAFNMSFEGIGDAIFDDEATFSTGFVNLLARYATAYAPELVGWLKESAPSVTNLNLLGNLISDIISKADKKVVLLIDEVDKSSNNQLFISFLAMLRNKYLDRRTFKTFHSIVLAGVHDVKSLKLKIRSDEEQKYNSPWNIATTYKVDLGLSPDDIKPMLTDYCAEQKVTMNTEEIAEQLFYFTSGYPYLVSHLCKIIDEDILPTKNVKEWTKTDVNKAAQIAVKEEGNANFDTLLKNLKNNEKLYQLVFSVVIDGDKVEYRLDDPIINLGSLYGIFVQSDTGLLIVHNRIYRERISNMMISEWRTTNLIDPKNKLENFGSASPYRLPNNGLDMERIIVNFQAFMRQQYSQKDRNFLERDGRLIFLAFMKPIINGVGYDFKEPQISEERRLDLVITFYQHQYVAELKVWRGSEANKKGLEQLADYLDRLGLATGYLLIYDNSKRKSWQKDWVEVKGKRIFWARV